MKLKRFYATDTTKAMRMIREAFGPDAVILSNQRTEDGVEVTAAVDYDASVLQEPSKKHSTESSKSTQAEWIQEPAMVKMREELQMLRELMQTQLAGFAWQDKKTHNPLEVKLLNECVNYSIPFQFAESLLSNINKNANFSAAWRQLEQNFVDRLPIANTDIINDGGIHALLGPTGVGKTTTLAKLAARFALRNGVEQMALITTDAYRIAAHEQLIAYGKILNIEVNLAENNEALQNLLHRYQHKRLVLIDTAGTSQRDPRLREQLLNFSNLSQRVHRHLVISTNASQRLVEETVMAYQRKNIDSCILTKVDETTSLASVLVAICQQHLPISYYTDGQRVPEDCRRAHAHQLVECAIELGKRYTNPLQHETIAQAMTGSLEHVE